MPERKDLSLEMVAEKSDQIDLEDIEDALYT
jgi:hypothetical protein